MISMCLWYQNSPLFFFTRSIAEIELENNRLAMSGRAVKSNRQKPFGGKGRLVSKNPQQKSHRKCSPQLQSSWMYRPFVVSVSTYFLASDSDLLPISIATSISASFTARPMRVAPQT